MWQQGQVFKLKAKGSDGQPLYGHMFDRAAHAERANAALEARYGGMV
jgi:hypothetical protein